MEKAFLGSHPSAVCAEKLFLVILLNLEKFLESYQGEDGYAFRSVMQAASMLTIECSAEQDAKRPRRDVESRIDKVIKRINTKTPVKDLHRKEKLRER